MFSDSFHAARQSSLNVAPSLSSFIAMIKNTGQGRKGLNLDLGSTSKQFVLYYIYCVAYFG